MENPGGALSGPGFRPGMSAIRLGACTFRPLRTCVHDFGESGDDFMNEVRAAAHESAGQENVGQIEEVLLRGVVYNFFQIGKVAESANPEGGNHNSENQCERKGLLFGRALAELESVVGRSQ